jgi:hypothetical protein
MGKCLFLSWKIKKFGERCHFHEYSGELIYTRKSLYDSESEGSSLQEGRGKEVWEEEVV